jgi:hypothetical protein
MSYVRNARSTIKKQRIVSVKLNLSWVSVGISAERLDQKGDAHNGSV